MKPIVSIITPSYNQGRFIRETIESVLTQDYDPIEYIIIDGGSTDQSLEIIQEYGSRLTYLSEKDHGQSNAINKGFKMAKGSIVAWLNSDDVYEPGSVSKAVEEFQKNDRLGLLYGDGYIIDENSRKLKAFEYTQEFDYWKLVNFWDYIMQPAAFFRKDALQKAGYLDEGLHYCMDWDLWIKLAAVSEVKYLPQLLACSREYADTKTSTGGEERLLEIEKLLKKYSKKDRPMGIASYRASTFYMKHSHDLWPIRKFAGWYLTYRHKWLNARMPVRYADGWIGKEYAFLMPDYVKQAVLSIETALPDALPQEIVICLNGKVVEVKRVVKCETTQVVIDNGKGCLNEVVLTCKKVVRAGRGDDRVLSVRISEIVFLNQAGNSE